jgi:hypothetical protein
MLCNPTQSSSQPFNLASLGVDLKIPPQQIASKFVESCEKGVLVAENGQKIPVTYKNDQIEISVDTKEDGILTVFDILKKTLVTFLQSNIEDVDKDKLISQGVTTLKALNPTEKNWESYRENEKAVKKILKRIVGKNISIVKRDKCITFTVMLYDNPLNIVVNYLRTDHNLFFEHFLKEVYTYFSQTPDHQNILTEQERIKEYIDKACSILNGITDFVPSSEFKTLISSYKDRFEQFREICAPLTPSPLLIPFTECIIELHHKIKSPPSNILFCICILRSLGKTVSPQHVLDIMVLSLQENEDTFPKFIDTNIPTILQEIVTTLLDDESAMKLSQILGSKRIFSFINNEGYPFIFVKLFDYLKKDESNLNNIRFLLKLFLTMHYFNDENAIVEIVLKYKTILSIYTLKTGDVDFYREHLNKAAHYYTIYTQLNPDDNVKSDKTHPMLIALLQSLIDLMGTDRLLEEHLPSFYNMIDQMYKVLNILLIRHNGTLKIYNDKFVMLMVMLCYHVKSKPEFKSKIEDLFRLFYVDETTSINEGVTHCFKFIQKAFDNQLTCEMFEEFVNKSKANRRQLVESMLVCIYVCCNTYKIDLYPVFNYFLEKSILSMTHIITSESKRVVYFYLHPASFRSNENTCHQFMIRLKYLVEHIKKSISSCTNKANLINYVLESDLIKLNNFADKFLIDILMYLIKSVKELNWEKSIVRDLLLNYVNDCIVKKYNITEQLRDHFLSTIKSGISQFPWQADYSTDDKVLDELTQFLKVYRIKSNEGVMLFAQTNTVKYLVTKLLDFTWKSDEQCRNTIAKIKSVIHAHCWKKYKVLGKALDQLNSVLQATLEPLNIEGLTTCVFLDDKSKSAIKQEYENLANSLDTFYTKIKGNFNLIKVREYTYEFYIQIFQPHINILNTTSMQFFTKRQEFPDALITRGYFFCLYELTNLYENAISKIDDKSKKDIMIIWGNLLITYFASNPQLNIIEQKEATEFIKKYCYLTLLFLNKKLAKENLHAFLQQCLCTKNVFDNSFYMGLANKYVSPLLIQR